MTQADTGLGFQIPEDQIKAAADRPYEYVWNAISPSQIELMMRCPRKWVEQFMFNNRVTEDEKQLRGTYLHSLIDEWVRAGKVPPPNTEKAVRYAFDQAVLRLGLNPRPSPDVFLSEYKFNAQFQQLPRKLKGSMDGLDLRYRDRGIVVIHDFKLKGSLDFAKTAEQLAVDIQMICYGASALQLGVARLAHSTPIHTIRVQHLTFCAYRPLTPIQSYYDFSVAELEAKSNWLFSTVGPLFWQYGRADIDRETVPTNVTACHDFRKVCHVKCSAFKNFHPQVTT